MMRACKQADRTGVARWFHKRPATLSVLVVASVLSAADARAQDSGPAHRNAMQQDYLASCTSEIAQMRQMYREAAQEMHVEADPTYGQDPNFIGVLFDATSPQLQWLPSEMRHDGPATAADLQIMATRIAQQGADPRQTALRLCAIRVAYRHLPGGAASRAPVRPNAVASRPAAPPRAPSASAGPAAAASAALSLGRTDLQASLRELNRLAAAGNSSAQFILGMMYSIGRGVPRPPARALMFMRQAAAQRLPQALQQLPAIEQQAQREANAGGTAVASPAPPPARREARVHNPALEATHCVRIVAYGTRGSRGFTQSIANHCGQVVEVSWCSTGGECERDSGNSWTLAASGPGSAYPIGSGAVRYGACLGRNSGGFAQGSQGQRLICTGDAGARPR